MAMTAQAVAKLTMEGLPEMLSAIMFPVIARMRRAKKNYGIVERVSMHTQESRPSKTLTWSALMTMLINFMTMMAEARRVELCDRG